MRIFAFACGMAALPLPVFGQALTTDALQGKTIEASVLYNAKARDQMRSYNGQVRADFVISINGNRLRGSVTRTRIRNGRDGPSTTRPMAAVFGHAKAMRGGDHALAILSGRKLTLLRTMQAGAVHIDITFSGSPSNLRCSIRAPLVREVGAGPIRRNDSVRGNPVEITSIRQASSSCRVR
jgi:hypothetical protein